VFLQSLRAKNNNKCFGGTWRPRTKLQWVNYNNLRRNSSLWFLISSFWYVQEKSPLLPFPVHHFYQYVQSLLLEQGKACSPCVRGDILLLHVVSGEDVSPSLLLRLLSFSTPCQGRCVACSIFLFPVGTNLFIGTCSCVGR